MEKNLNSANTALAISHSLLKSCCKTIVVPMGYIIAAEMGGFYKMLLVYELGI